MSQSLVNQITLDCLLNKEMIGKHIMKQREKQINKEDLKFYRKKIFNLFTPLKILELVKMGQKQLKDNSLYLISNP